MEPARIDNLEQPERLSDEAVVEQAARRGISPDYYDIFGTHHHVQPEVLRRILDAIGPEPQSDPLPETLVITHGEERDLPSSAALKLENGEVRIVGRLDASIPLGYHQLTLESDGHAARTHLIVCPPHMWEPPEKQRCSGIVISLYGLRSNQNWGVGDLRDLRDFVSWASEAAAAEFVALNPLHAIHNRIPYNASPYLPLCSYYRNFLYLDVEDVEEFALPSIREQFANNEVQREIEALRASEYVEYERVAALKLRFLRLCFEEYLKQPHDDFFDYVGRHGNLLRDFALYCALDKHFRETMPGTWIWQDWPEPYRTPGSSESQKFAEENKNEILFYSWLQWQLDRQLSRAQDHAKHSGMAIGLYHDLALATDRSGCDLWANRQHFIEGCRVGAPPDDFSPEGQDWAFPPMNGAQHVHDGYRLYIASIRHNTSHGGALRLDHVMRLFRLFWIPDGFSAKDGTYVYERWRDLLGIIALESHRLQVRIVGEDLGTITDEMREGLEQYGVIGYRLLYFERGQDGGYRDPKDYFPRAVACTTTHDLPTLRGFWLGKDIESRREAGLLPDDESYSRQMDERRRDKQLLLDRLHSLNLLPEGFSTSADAIQDINTEMRIAILRMLASTPCELLAINQEDITFEAMQQNLPGSTAQYPNWRRKMNYSIDELRSKSEIAEFCEKLRKIFEDTGRLAHQ